MTIGIKMKTTILNNKYQQVHHRQNEDVEHIIEDHDDVDLWVKTTWQGTRPGTGGKASFWRNIYIIMIIIYNI